MAKLRADLLMLNQNLAPSREKARALIMAGVVFVDTKPITKPGEMLSEETILRVKEEICPYVSRGGLKLKKAIDCFSISLSGKTCADIGASTGGFTDCMLKEGASFVYAIDVGYGQLDWSLRNDTRVKVMERTNARYLTTDDFHNPINFASVDVSFISLKLIFPVLKSLSVPHIITLIKPQFEAGREKVGKHGVVKEPAVHEEVIENVFSFAQENGFYPQNLSFSPIKGPSGNIEYIAEFSSVLPAKDINIAKIVMDSHEILNDF